MRILHVAQPVEAGVPRVVVDLLTDQVGRGWDAWLACPPAGWLPGVAEEAGAHVLPWQAARSPDLHVPGEARRLAAVVRQVRPDLVHLHSGKAGLAGRLALRGCLPTVFQPHAWTFLAADGPVGAASLRWERWAGRWTDLVVAVSEDEDRRGREAGVRAPTVVTPNGVDLQRWRPRDRGVARAELGLGQGPVAVCAGRLARQKGQDALAGVWPEVRSRVPGARLLLVGDGPEREALKRAAGPGVELRGAQDDLGPWYAAADVVVVPSRWEGMALVPLEAMASGRSVVVTEVDGARETLGPDAGAVVPLGEPGALVEAVVRRLADGELRSREEAAGRARAGERFDVRICAARVGDVVAGLVRS